MAFALAADAARPDDCLELCRFAEPSLATLPAPERPSGDAEWISAQYIEALIAEPEPESALRAARGRFAPDSPVRRDYEIRLLILLERRSEAVDQAARWTSDSPKDPSAWRALARARVAARDFAGAAHALSALRALDDSKSESSLFALARHYEAQRPDAARAVIADILLRHGANPALYPALASVMANAKAEADLARLETELLGLGYPRQPVFWARLEIAVQAHDWPDVLRQVALLRTSPGARFTDTQSAWLGTTGHLALACLDGGSGVQASLLEFISDHPGNLRHFRRVLVALLEARKIDTAAGVLTLAGGLYPDSRGIIASRATIAARQ